MSIKKLLKKRNHQPAHVDIFDDVWRNSELEETLSQKAGFSTALLLMTSCVAIVALLNNLLSLV